MWKKLARTAVKKTGDCPDFEGEGSANSAAKYVLTVTHTGARRWLSNLFTTVTRDWGYDFVKLDFVQWTLLAAEQSHDPGMSRAQSHRVFQTNVPDSHTRGEGFRFACFRQAWKMGAASF